MSTKNAMEGLLLHSSIFKIQSSMPSGRKKLDWRKLGLEVVTNPELVSDGQIWVVPRERMNRILSFRAKAQQILDQHGIKFSFGQIVPSSSREEVIQRLQRVRDEFMQEVERMRMDYPALKQELLNKWNEESVIMSSRTGNADKVFEIMNSVGKLFPEWEQFWRGDIRWTEYTDLQQMAQEFVGEATRGILQQMQEFADSLRQKIEASGLSERNLTPIRNWIDNVRESVRVFQNERLDSLLEELESCVQEGTANDVSASSRIRESVSGVLAGISDASAEHVDEIIRESINGLTSQRRSLDR